MTPESHPLSLSRDIGNWLWPKDRAAVTDSYEPLLAAVIAIRADRQAVHRQLGCGLRQEEVWAHGL
jgi:hypothetical protein